MNRTNHSLRWLQHIIMLLVSCAYTAAHAQPASTAEQITAIAGLDQRLIMMGENALLYLRVENAQPEPPTIPEVPGLSIVYFTYSDQQSSTSVFVNGQLTSKTTVRRIYTYVITPQSPGTYTIPSIEIDTITVPGAKPRTSPLALSVGEPLKIDDIFVELVPPRRAPYVGEPFELILRLGFRNGISTSNVSISMPSGEGIFRPTVSASQSRRMAARNRPMFFGRPLNSVRSFEMRDGIEFEVFTTRRTIIATEEGSQSLGPVFLTLDYAPVGRNLRRFGTRIAVPSDPLELNIAPLPNEGKPAGFNGLVGSYTARASANATSAKVGDPIALYLTVGGPDPIDRVKPPLLSTMPGFDAFRVDTDDIEVQYMHSDDAQAQGTAQALITYLIRPTSDAIKEIPAISIPFFDVEQGEYGIATSEPMPLKMEASRTITAADGLGSADQSSSNLALQSTQSGLMPNAPADTLSRPADLTLSSITASPVVIAAVTAPPSVLCASLLFVGIRRMRSSNSPAARRARSISEARSLLANHSTDPTTDVRNALSLVLAGVSHAPRRSPDAITASDAHVILHQHPALADRFATTLHATDTAAYAPGIQGGDNAELRTQALTLIDVFEETTR